ncbi:acetyl-CoA carboxylase biotin carboxyl carrier protein [Rhizobium sp. G21]|uniref:acetyl-CoA carboxylase biotin carboxyl carrier protein n=1 Tax=Rhizobium sp. G21 TaxID=2758439 RepID=UPI0016020452|nr:biotin/lipoyl-containing protein [Rhizobium sp. G21]MBB1249286.1 acetyl-CoA carboxylase biotin carboxyl carrier protein [Rhizobium sp. G21]
MDFDLIDRLMRMLEASDLNELDVTEGGMRIRLVKQASEAELASSPKPSAAPRAPASTADMPSGTRRIKAGMAGTFYRSPAPGAKPFVEAGDRVRDGDQIAIIEAMKLLNPVEAECDGVVTQIMPADGDGVEPGTLLFTIESET